jgi:hypothetical protein
MTRYSATLKVQIVYSAEDDRDYENYIRQQLKAAAEHLAGEGLLSGEDEGITVDSWMPSVIVEKESSTSRKAT